MLDIETLISLTNDVYRLVRHTENRMENLTKILAENMYGFYGVKATIGVWVGFVGFLGMFVMSFFRK